MTAQGAPQAGAASGAMRAERPTAAAERVYLELVHAYQNPILNYIFRLVGDIDVAEDLTQDVFVRAYGALARLELDADAEPRRRAWLYRIAHNVATDSLRRKGRLAWLPFSNLRGHVGSGSPEGAMAAAEPVRAAMAALTADQREVLLLFGVAGMEAAEVAEVLGITEEAARKRRQRAREAFVARYAAADPDAV
jgi:RNA polymerase sigma-70 factor (ECF subfamily)